MAKNPLCKFLLAVSVAGLPLRAQNPSVDTLGANADTLQEQMAVQQDSAGERKKVPARKAWEKPVSAPLWAATSPLIATLKGFEAGSAYAYAAQLPRGIFNLLVSPDTSRYIIPTYSSSSNLGLGVEFVKKNWIRRGSVFSAKVTYGLYNSASAQVSMQNVRVFSPDLALYTGVYGGFLYFPDESFYGIGNNTSDDDKTFYALEAAHFTPSLTKKIGRFASLNVIPSLDWYRQIDSPNDNSPSTGDLFFASTVPGVDGKTLLLSLSTGATFDNRDSKDRPRRGFVGGLRVGYTGEIPWSDVQDDLDRNEFGFGLLEADVRSFIEIPWGDYHVIMLRGEVQTLASPPGKQVPFYLQSYLGDSDNNRGLPRNRYTDNQRLLVSAQYTFPIWTIAELGVMDAFVFADAGQVAADLFSDFAFDEFHPTGGFGFHFIWQSASVARLTLGFGASSVKAYLSLF